MIEIYYKVQWYNFDRWTDVTRHKTREEANASLALQRQCYPLSTFRAVWVPIREAA